MALTEQQLWTVTKIDARMQRILAAGKDNMAIMAAMADHMPRFKLLLDSVQPGDMEQLARKFPGFHRYAKLLEALATGMQSGAIPVPGPAEPPRQTQPMADHRQRAAAIDLRMRQLAEQTMTKAAIIGSMAGYVTDLGTVWNVTSDEQLAALCDAYPGFRAYAALMEDAAAVERQKPARPYDDLPELPDALKEQLSSLLGTAAKLERDHQAVLDAAAAPAPMAWHQSLSGLHVRWDADLARFRAAILQADIPEKSRDTVLPMLERMAQHITTLQTGFRRRD